MFYFSGGEEEGCDNYLIPTCVNPALPRDQTAYSTSDLVRELGTNSAVTVIILDACRANPRNNTFKAAHTKGGAKTAPLLKDVNALEGPRLPPPQHHPAVRVPPRRRPCTAWASRTRVAFAGHLNGQSAFTGCLLELLQRGVDLFSISMHLAKRVPDVADQRPFGRGLGEGRCVKVEA